MKKVGLIGATGSLGSILLTKMNNMSSEFEITPIVRNSDKLNVKNSYIEKNLFELLPEDVKDFDYLICAYGPPTDNPNELIRATSYLINLLENNKHIALSICGGVGPLYMDDKKDVQVADSPSVPPGFVLLAKAEAEAYKVLASSQLEKYLYFSPPFKLSKELEIKNDYVISGDVLRFSDDGTSELSYEDYAQSIIDNTFLSTTKYNKIISVSKE